MNYKSKIQLNTPEELRQKYPLTQEGEELRRERLSELRSILAGDSDKFIIIIGPCSADREKSVLDYAERLRKLSDEVKSRVFLIPRVYTSKPRTLGKGYKGLIHNPTPDGEQNMALGIDLARRLHTRVVNEIGLTSAEEMLYPEAYAYFSDLLGYTAIGARSTENQYYRLIASSAETPVGFKNPTSGNIDDMLNAAEAAQMAGSFLYGGYAYSSDGNPYSHCILRGGHTADGGNAPNYGYDSLVSVCEKYACRSLKNPAILIDANHSNSGKNHTLETPICLDVMESRRRNPDIRRLVKGVMVESYIESDCQSPSGNTYGKSVTDPCIGWDETERLIKDIADMM